MPKPQPKFPKKGDTVFFWWSSSEVAQVTFIRWCRMRNSNGRKESTNKIGTGAIVHSVWRFSKVILKRPPHGLRRGFYRIRPYVDLYRTSRNAYMHTRAIRRPEPKAIK